MSGARHVLGAGNATQARHLVLPATRPAVGDRVRHPATTFAATASAVLSCGWVPSVDVDDRFLADTKLLSGDAEPAIVVHLDGRVVGISNVRCVIQDCAQAMGAVHPDGAMVGTKGFAGLCRLLEERSIPTFTPLDRYFLPDHPVLRDRKSLYSDNFPWNLVEGDLCAISRDGFRPDQGPTGPNVQHPGRAPVLVRRTDPLQRPRPLRPLRREVMRPCLLLVDGRPGTFTDHVLSRDDLDLVLLRFEEHLSSLPTDHLLRTADIPTFTIDADADIRREAERYLTWVAGLPTRPAHFCNPQEPLQEISQRFAGLVGLPHLDAEQVAWVRDKTAMKRRFREIGIPCAEFAEVVDGDEVLGFAAAHGWPLILKPVDGWSSIDTYKLNDEHDLARLLPLPPTRRWMVEEFLTGREYQLCALVAHGRVLDTYLSWTPCALLETIYGGINGSISLGVDNELGIDEKELVQRIVDGMRIDHGYLHMEFFRSDDGGIHMSEVGARLAGCELPSNHGFARNFDMMAATLDTYLARVPSLEYLTPRCAGDLLLPYKPGRVVKVTPLETLLSMPGVVHGRMNIAIGDDLPDQRASHASAGYVQIVGPSRQIVEDRMNGVLDAFALVTEDVS
ncbi:DegT/DnrJ/EryC1/StrS family aminotransferase [Streptomyces chartreusis]|uniref:DegT/DnrJ/EryC1/StrS family aminotransferase n=1 Tax=Streptomyces chartreusis TaxID=1969 RepID=UPI003720BF60